MMLPSHLLATLIVCALLALVRPMPRREWLLALAFGVVIDLDHLLQMPAYVATHGLAEMTPAAISAWGAAWQGFMHTPWALALVLPAVFVFRSPVPLVFWALHMVQDFVVARHLVVFGSPLEWAIDLALLGVLSALAWHDHTRHGRGASLRAHVLARVAMALPRR
jgi:hypothetical protein